MFVFRGIPKAWSWAHFGQGRGPIQLDAVQCTGNELSLDECPHSGWEQHNCDHMEDAGVSCNPYTGQDTYINDLFHQQTSIPWLYIGFSFFPVSAHDDAICNKFTRMYKQLYLLYIILIIFETVCAVLANFKHENTHYTFMYHCSVVNSLYFLYFQLNQSKSWTLWDFVTLN